MKNDTFDSLLVDAALDRLNETDKAEFEEQIRNDPELMRRYFEVQAIVEHDLFEWLESETIGETDLIGIKKEVDKRLFPKKETHPFQLKWWWLTAAASFLLMLALVPLLKNQILDQQSSGEFFLSGPALVVYDITDGVAMDYDTLKSGANVREVLYINSDRYDGLARAEAYAEQLWAEHHQSVDSSLNDVPHPRKGFVVLDLAGKQGFAGFYDNADHSSDNKVIEHHSLWLAGGGDVRDVPLVNRDPKGGVFYFSLEGNEIKLSTLNEFVPVINQESAGEI